MNHVDMVYCVECNMIITKVSAAKIFKTGFFKTTIPLAHCTHCVNTKSKEVSVGIGDATHECYTEYTMPISLMA